MRFIVQDHDTRIKCGNREPIEVRICFITTFKTNHDEFGGVVITLSLKCFARKRLQEMKWLIYWEELEPIKGG
jgi:hypothetical protein